MWGYKTYETRIKNLQTLKTGLENIATDIKPTEKMYKTTFDAYLKLANYKKTSQVFLTVINLINHTELTATWDETKDCKYNYTIVRKTSTETIVNLLKNGNLKKYFEQNKPIYDNLIKNITDCINFYKLLANSANTE